MPRVSWNRGFTVLAAIMLTADGTAVAQLGPYSSPMANAVADAPDAGIPGFVGPDGEGKCREQGANNYVNPLFVGWATGYTVYDPFNLAGIQNYSNGAFAIPENTLGPVTGHEFDVASLGDLHAFQIEAWQADPVNNHGPGTITLTFAKPITNGPGADFAVFENGFISTTPGQGEGGVFAELAYVEVSSNGTDFARFPCVSLNNGILGDPAGLNGLRGYATQDASLVYNLAGKHVNAYGDSWGTPFNLDDLLADPLVQDETIDLAAITHVRLVDIPGGPAPEDGGATFWDNATALIDPTTGLNYTENHPIYDAWTTWGSGGLDLDAIGVIHHVPEPEMLAGILTFIGTAGLWWTISRHGKKRA